MLLALKQSSENHGNIKVLYPITGSPASPGEAAEPMTGDVHLYPDQATYGTRMPLFFADSEGLDGGDQEPASLKWKISKNTSPRSRKIEWATRASGLKREDVVADLFPKILYTFSDVVVFVLSNPRYDLLLPRLLVVCILTGTI